MTTRDITLGEAMWTDETGRTWNSYGSLVLSDDLLQSTRQKLVEFLRGVYLDSVNVYDYPPDVMKLPALIVNPSDPYIEPFDVGGPMHAVWGFEVVLLTSRAKVDESLTRLEFMWAKFQDVLKGYDNARWVSFGEIGTTDVGDIPMLSGTVSVVIVDEIKEAS